MDQGGRKPARAIGLRHLLGLVVILGAALYIVTSSLSHAVYYYEVDEVVGQTQHLGERMRVRGEVVDQSHRLRRGSLDEHLFLLRQDGATLTVVYQGVLPERFGPGVGLVATGVLVEGDLLQADQLSTQCPSRYQSLAPTSLRASGELQPEGPGQ
ncbi:MAG: cytochrome c maturation protein CcmE [Bradymonadales bacterium]|nr:cytochrome c maturation protein CcmE [Bradymonadales bacterium]